MNIYNSSSTGLGAVALLVAFTAGCSSDETEAPIYPPPDWSALANAKSGISLGLSGTPGVDWAVESTYHDDSIADELVYLRSSVHIHLAHNERNAITLESDIIPRVLGLGGIDGLPHTGDEGDIHFKLDRDMQAHSYSGERGALPAFATPFTAPFALSGATYDGALPVLGSVGDNGAAWGDSPSDTTERFAYGQVDGAGNEWHTLTYWDNDVPLITAAGEEPHRQGASDGHRVLLCVDPQTPIVQLRAAEGEQYYTTPLKTYHVPKLWAQTTYLTAGVELAFVNLTNGEPVHYRLASSGAEPFVAWDNAPLRAGDLVTASDEPFVLELKAGEGGAVMSRTVVLLTEVPASGEAHGHLLWADEQERAAIVAKLAGIQPFTESYDIYRDSHEDPPLSFDDTRGGWRHEAWQASSAMAQAFIVAMAGAGQADRLGESAKLRLLRLARLEPVGMETSVSHATPAKDYLNELGQTLQQFGDAGIAYDWLAAHFRHTDAPAGMTPIEELRIRDGLGEIAKSMLQFRDNYGATSGGGDSHWPHGYELALGLIALAMPTYATPYHGVSGGDRQTVNDLTDGAGQYHNPFPDQGVTWYAAATDPVLECPGHPNVSAPFRAEFLLSDDGWWTGANDLQCDGDRYFEGPNGSRLVDVKYGGLANAECRVELAEMSGYESPFVKRLYAFDHARRTAGDPYPAAAVNTYLRRRLLSGVVYSSWDEQQQIYTLQSPSITSAIYGFHHRYGYASLPGPVAMVGDFLAELNAYYGLGGTIDDATRERLEQERKVFYDAYGLALCEDPSMLPAHQADANHAPIVKALFKHVVRSGERIHKEILAVDLDGDPLTLTVTGLPADATFDSATRTIEWTPTGAAPAVHIAEVTADDGQAQTTRPFAMILKPDAPAGPIPEEPTAVVAQQAGSTIELSWTPPEGVSVAAYFIYRDGLLWAAVPSTQTAYTDGTPVARSNTRYHVSACATSGAESSAASAPGYLQVSSL